MPPDDFAAQAGAETSRGLRDLLDLAERRALMGDWPSAAAALQQALANDPSDVGAWLNLAGAQRRLGRVDDERAALERALSLQPRNLQALFDVARLYQAQGDTRLAASAYRMALEGIPANADLNASAREAVARARSVIHANNVALETFVEDRLRPLRGRWAEAGLRRFDKALDTFLLKRRVYRPTPSFLYVPQLPAFEFYEREDFPWLGDIEAASDAIRGELLEVLGDRDAPVRPYMAIEGMVAEKWRELNQSRRWSVFDFWREGRPHPANIARCPRTMAALASWPRCDIPGCGPTAMFSILEPRTRIPPHTGVNNARLVVHLPLVIPPGCGFRVGAETRPWIPGQAFIFDDTIEHEAWNDSDQPRAVLILDIWNPQLSAAEREMVRALTVAIDEFYQDLPGFIRPVQAEV